jgi:signal transduction protein with GAF and PtsI domain
MAPPALALDRGLLPRLARAMTASLGLGDVLAAASRTAAELVPDSFVLVWILDGDRLVLRGAAGVLEGMHSGLRTDLASGEGLAGHVARGRQPLVIDDVAHDPRARRRDFLLAERVRWFVGIPLSARYALEGVLGVFIRGPEPPEPEVLDALGALAAQAALAVESASPTVGCPQPNPLWGMGAARTPLASCRRALGRGRNPRTPRTPPTPSGARRRLLNEEPSSAWTRRRGARG